MSCLPIKLKDLLKLAPKSPSGEIKHLAVYGTLRDDDDSGSSWTATFLQGLKSSQSATVSGFEMWQTRDRRWPLAFPSLDPNETICVRMLEFADQFEEKIIEADEIEVVRWDDSAQSETSEYFRVEVDAQISNRVVRCYMYVANDRPESNENWQRISSGDWLQRDRTFI